MNVLALNPGSNSLRYKLVAVEPGGERVLLDRYIDRVKGPATADAAARAVADCQPQGVAALGFRVVHGGERYADPARVTPERPSAGWTRSPSPGRWPRTRRPSGPACWPGWTGSASGSTTPATAPPAPTPRRN